MSNQSAYYLPGNIVCWNLRGAITHIGIVYFKKSRDKKRRLMVHYIEAGQMLKDCLFNYTMIGHYKYTPKYQFTSSSLRVTDLQQVKQATLEKCKHHATYSVEISLKKHYNLKINHPFC